MYQPTDEDFDAVVALSQARGIDPLAVALLEFEESGFDPSAVNRGSSTAGLNQMTPANLRARGYSVESWTALPICHQQREVFEFWDAIVRDFAGGTYPSDAAGLLALNFLPGRYRDRGCAGNRDAALTTQGESFYRDNPALDPKPKAGKITVATIASYLQAYVLQHATAWARIESGIAAAVARAAPPEASA